MSRTGSDASDAREQPQPMRTPHPESFNRIWISAKQIAPSLGARVALAWSFALHYLVLAPVLAHCFSSLLDYISTALLSRQSPLLILSHHIHGIRESANMGSVWQLNLGMCSRPDALFLIQCARTFVRIPSTMVLPLTDWRIHGYHWSNTVILALAD